MFKKGHEKNEVLKEISSCVEERFNGLHIISNISIRKYQMLFANEIRLAYRANYANRKKNDSRIAEQCYYCNTFVVNKPNFKKHLKVCSRKPGITYKFLNQHFSTYEENFRLLGHLPFTVYFDLETTCGKNLYEDPLNPSKIMCPVSYSFIIIFNPWIF